MATLVFRFPGGRYHATPTGHHVNEGIVEWPPSPWRLARALLACGYTTQRWDEVPPAGRRLLDALCSVLPEYRLPRAALGHSRHYMPTAVLDKGREKTTLVLDSFADLGSGEIWVRWPVHLDPEAAALFATLADHLGYLGRSESWVTARSVADDMELPEDGRAFPHVDGSRPGRGYEQLALVAPDVPRDYVTWRERESARALAMLVGAGGKPPTKAQLNKKKQQIEDGHPPDLIACLHCDTAWWKERKWSQAPGSRHVLYWREANLLEVAPPARARRSEPRPIEAALFALTTPSGSRSALPALARTLPQAERIHRALVSKLGFDHARPCPELTGKDGNGHPLRGHRHAHVIPLDLDEDGHLDHVVVFAPMGLGAEAQRALGSLKRTYSKGGVGELQVALAGQGTLGDLRRLGGKLGTSIDLFLGPIGGATSWTSATPLVLPRHMKRRGRNTLKGQVLAELESRGMPHAKVEVLPWTTRVAPLRHVVRRRSRGAPQPPADAAFVVRLQFAAPVVGPLCLGYASHFGLGRFAASLARDDARSRATAPPG